MQSVYGTSLPPEVEGGTKGELRIRVEKLILDHETINHNPLVRLFDTPSQDSGAVSNRSSPKKVSPNRFVVPVDFCAVSPLFWGESQPSSSCQPATPQQTSRGSITLVYPIKVERDVFEEYLATMVNGPHKGMLLQVSVPSSYSGRSTLPVGHSTIPLGGLLENKPVSGWFTVSHEQSQLIADRNGGEEDRNTLTIPIGKVKLHITVNYFSGSPKSRRNSSMNSKKNSLAGSPSKPSVSQHKKNVVVRQPSTEKDKEVNSSAEADPHHTAAAACTPPPSVSTIPHSSTNETVSQGSYPVPGNVATSGLEEIIKKGVELRGRMSEAARKGLEDYDGLADGRPPVGPTQSSSSLPLVDTAPLNGLMTTPTPTAAIPREENPPRNGVPEVSPSAGKSYDADDETDYTSERSDEEQFALQLQQETEYQEREENLRKGIRASGGSFRAPPNGPKGKTPFSKHSSPITPLNTTHSGECVQVDMFFEDISFAVTDLTSDLKEIRLSVRLSKDVTTEEPSAGPFSSFVHKVPLAQNGICLSFLVRRYSEQHSRIVVECFKVNSRPSTVQGSRLLPDHDPNAPRVIVSEELLGISIVGFYNQSRDLVLHEPVSNENHVHCKFSLRIDGLEAPEVHLGEEGRAEREADEESEGEEDDEGDNDEEFAEGEERRNSRGTGEKKKSRVSFGGEELWNRGATLSASEYESPRRRSSFKNITPSPTEVRRSVSSKRNSHMPLSHEEIVHPSRSAQFPSRHPSVSQGAYLTTAGSVSYAPTPVNPLRSSLLGSGSPFVYESPNAQSGKTSAPFRLHISISGARQLPLVALAKKQTDDYTTLMHSADNFSPPNTFFVVEEIFSGTEKSNSAAVSEWAVEEATGGYYDRTCVIPKSQKPQFNYECIVNLPHESVFLQQQVPMSEREEIKALQRRGVALKKGTLLQEQSSPSASDTVSAKPCLQQVLLTLWHLHDGAPPSSGPMTAEEELAFWSNAAYMGECRVDLRPLRFIRRVEGYYRVDRGDSRLPPTEEVAPLLLPPSSRHRGSTVGYVHLGVSLL